MRSSALLELQLKERTEPSSVLYMNCLLSSPLLLNLLLPPECQQDSYHLAFIVTGGLVLLAIEKFCGCNVPVAVYQDLSAYVPSTDRSAQMVADMAHAADFPFQQHATARVDALLAKTAPANT